MTDVHKKFDEKNQHAKFATGQIIHHKLFGYTGLIFDVDAIFQGSEEWYQQVARSRPIKNQPWYHVLVDEESHITYVAEQNIEVSAISKEIVHPLVNELFAKFDGKQYSLRRQKI